MERREPRKPRSLLGIVYAGLGRNDDAIREGEMAVRAQPISKDWERDLNRVVALAQIHLMLGDHDGAIEQLEIALSHRSFFISVTWLRLDPLFDPLRDHPRFQALLEKYE